MVFCQTFTNSQIMCRGYSRTFIKFTNYFVAYSVKCSQNSQFICRVYLWNSRTQFPSEMIVIEFHFLNKQNTDHPDISRHLEIILSSLASTTRLSTNIGELNEYERSRYNASNNSIRQSLGSLIQLSHSLCYNRTSGSN